MVRSETGSLVRGFQGRSVASAARVSPETQAVLRAAPPDALPRPLREEHEEPEDAQGRRVAERAVAPIGSSTHGPKEREPPGLRELLDAAVHRAGVAPKQPFDLLPHGLRKRRDLS